MSADRFHRSGGFGFQWLVFQSALSLGLYYNYLVYLKADVPCSVKWVGMFVTCLVGAYTLEDLWNKFGDLRISWVRSFSFNDYMTTHCCNSVTKLVIGPPASPV